MVVAAFQIQKRVAGKPATLFIVDVGSLFPSGLVAEHIVYCILIFVVALYVANGNERSVTKQLVEYVLLRVQGHHLANWVDILFLHNLENV